MLINMSTYMLRINICLDSYVDYEKNQKFSRRRWFLIIHLEKSLQVLFCSPIVICLLLLHSGYYVASFDMMLPNPEKHWG